MNETRKLAAILVSDVVGYSRLAGADEDRILARLRTLRSAPRLDPLRSALAKLAEAGYGGARRPPAAESAEPAQQTAHTQKAGHEPPEAVF
jgi:hypothetical protein